MLVQVSREEAIDFNYPRGCLKRVNYWSGWYYVDHRRQRRQARRAYHHHMSRCTLGTACADTNHQLLKRRTRDLSRRS